MYEIFAINLRDLRKRKGLTQQELAVILDVSQSTISTWESGEVIPPIKEIIKFAKTLNCTIEELLGIEKLEFQDDGIKEKKETIQTLDHLINHMALWLDNDLLVLGLSTELMNNAVKLARIMDSRNRYENQIKKRPL